MKTLQKTVVLLGLLFLPLTPLLAMGGQEQEDDTPADPAMAGRVTLAGDKEVQSLLGPYEQAVVTVVVGTTPYRFTVDTGVRITSISRRIVEENASQLAMAPSISMMDGSLYSVKKLMLGGVVLTDFPVMNLPVEQARLPEGVDGQLGMNFLERVPFELNLKNRTLTLFKNAPRLDKPVDLNTFWDHRLVVNGEVDGQLAKWTIDTGAVRGAFFNPSFYDPSLASVVLQKGESGAASYYWQDAQDPMVAVAKKVSVGNQTLDTMTFQVTRVKPYYRTDYSGLFNTTGILPLEFFQGKVLRVDYPNGKISWDGSS